MLHTLYYTTNKLSSAVQSDGVHVYFFFFFFFQAEDGIRDYKVTGVQTCALPISGLPAAAGDAALLSVHSRALERLLDPGADVQRLRFAGPAPPDLPGRTAEQSGDRRFGLLPAGVRQRGSAAGLHADHRQRDGGERRGRRPYLQGAV